MAKDKMYGKTLRKNFARHEEIMEMPNLLELQKKSYQWFLDDGTAGGVHRTSASITDYAGNLELSFIDYTMDEAPKYDVEECKARDATYAAPHQGAACACATRRRRRSRSRRSSWAISRS